MILAGAGGHALELFDLIVDLGLEKDLEVFDQDKAKVSFKGRFDVLHGILDLNSQDFCIGVGTPKSRNNLYDYLSGKDLNHLGIQSQDSRISPSARVEGVDIFHNSFIGPEAKIGKGSLVNTGAQVHHECRVGEFSVINPGAYLLGAVEIGNNCSIGAHATILPGIKLGNGVTVGAGAVVTRDIEDGKTVVGVPGKLI